MHFSSFSKACFLCASILLFKAFPQTTPPTTWTEHWFEHVQVLTRVYYNADVAIYFDPDMDRSITWMDTIMDKVWKYTKLIYGNFGTENRLYCVYHQGRYGGGHPATYLDASHDYRNTIDCGAGPWDSPTGWAFGAPIHEVSHIVEGGSKGVGGSPAFTIWGDSKWAEIFQYDVYLGIGKTTEAAALYSQMQSQTDAFPRAGTKWFVNWFYPIWNTYGKATALNSFFTLLSQYFPKSNGQYTRDMNLGEFVYFWSGAANANLKSLATTAFGWTATTDSQWNAAFKTFPAITFSGKTTRLARVVEPLQNHTALTVTKKDRVVAIGFVLSRPSAVSLSLFDAAGNRVAMVMEEHRGAGPQEFEWHFAQFSRCVKPGVYYLRLETNGAKSVALISLP